MVLVIEEHICMKENQYAPNLGENAPPDAQLDPLPWWAKAIRQEV